MRISTVVAFCGFFLILQMGMEFQAFSHGPPAEASRDHAAESAGEHRQAPAVSADAPANEREWVEEKTGDYLPLTLVLRGEDGEETTLDRLIDKPTVLLPVYYYCAGSCSRNLANLASSVDRMKSVPGKDFRILAFSINEQEKIEDARRAKKTFLKLITRDFPESEWRFLTGDRDAIAVLTSSLGYRFERSGDGTFIHPSALAVVGSDGRIIRYVYGQFIAGDIDMAIAAAVRDTPSLSVKRLLDICFSADPEGNTGIIQTVKVVVLAITAAAVAALLLRFRNGRRSDERIERDERKSTDRMKP